MSQSNNSWYQPEGTKKLYRTNNSWEERFDLPVYYRSKFSQDCSRNETEEEKNTEMVELSQAISFIQSELDNRTREIIEEIPGEPYKYVMPDFQFQNLKVHLRYKYGIKD